MLTAVLLLTLGVVLGCVETPLTGTDSPDETVESVMVSPSSVDGWAGDTVRLTAAARDPAGEIVSDASFDWSSGDTMVAVVDGSGLVTLRSDSGSTVMTAALQSVSDMSATAEARSHGTRVDAIVVTPESATVSPGHQIQLAATVQDAAGDEKTSAVTWSSSDTAVATVDDEGLVTAQSTGSATITATADSVSGSAEVSVSPVPVTSVEVTPSSSAITVGETVQLEAAVEDSAGDPLDRTVAWASSDASVAAVDASGQVTGQEEGTVDIIATSEARADTATVEVTASQTPPAMPTDLALSNAASTGDSATWEATWSGSSGATSYVWSSGSDAGRWSREGSVESTSVAFSTPRSSVPDTSYFCVAARNDAGTTENRCDGFVVPAENSPGGGDVASVEMTPSTAAIEVGGTVELNATAFDAAGDVVSATFTWTSTSPSVATVDPSGVVAGESEGEAEVVAAADGSADTTVVQVSSGDSSAGGAAECADPEAAWIWCDDFEQDRLASYFEYDNAGGAFTREAGVGRDGSTAMRARFSTGDVSLGFIHLAFGRTPDPYFDPVDQGTADYREIYWRLYVKYEADWTGGGGSKLSRATAFATPGWAQAMAAPVWSGGQPSNHDYLVVDPVSGTDEAGNLMSEHFNDGDNQRWLGAERGDIPLFNEANVGTWYCVEAHVRLNDPGNANGVFELWIDGQKDAERTGLNWVGDYQDYGINAVFVENYWNDGSPQAQERYIDNFVVSTERIGC